MITGNKGEWSEIYALFRLLGEGKVHAGDADLNKLKLYYPILNIIREEDRRYEYKPNKEKNLVVIDEDGNEFARFPMTRFRHEAALLLETIQDIGNIRAFEIPSAENFMHIIGCSRLKAPSSDKSDIQIVIHDMRTNMTPQLGFSIKSQLGSASTLLNASAATNITYHIIGGDISDEEIEEINAIDNHLPRMEALIERGCHLQYHDIDSDRFKNNLLFIDTCMPQFIAECLINDSMPDATSSVKDTVKMVAKKNPFNYTGNNILSFYEHKMKVFLIDVALGMNPSKPWNGRYDANGGYLVVKKDGDIVCYHFYNRNDVEDYLFNNTRFERASRKRHGYGFLYRDVEGCVCLKLNLQIRFNQ